jgi:GH15 family glucan-1,4-alpha-glucosidase
MRIFNNTGYYIRMLMDVMYDMRFFLLILAIGIVAFSDSYLAISMSNIDDNRFVSGFGESVFYTYT